ncbi:Neuroendocrine convertase 2 [Trichuris trichiura]|uniref:Neuroendocrine convertase 2 n=1 Tax=Trichuris trichiura TaxID=36087 RepID=A0A077ZK53_TRITR|nr:Neuroendocrine convertase 2 [Trichuris trichiura]
MLSVKSYSIREAYVFVLATSRPEFQILKLEPLIKNERSLTVWQNLEEENGGVLFVGTPNGEVHYFKVLADEATESITVSDQIPIKIDLKQYPVTALSVRRLGQEKCSVYVATAVELRIVQLELQKLPAGDPSVQTRIEYEQLVPISKFIFASDFRYATSEATFNKLVTDDTTGFSECLIYCLLSPGRSCGNWIGSSDLLMLLRVWIFTEEGRVFVSRELAKLTKDLDQRSFQELKLLRFCLIIFDQGNLPCEMEQEAMRNCLCDVTRRLAGYHAMSSLRKAKELIGKAKSSVILAKLVKCSLEFLNATQSTSYANPTALTADRQFGKILKAEVDSKYFECPACLKPFSKWESPSSRTCINDHRISNCETFDAIDLSIVILDFCALTFQPLLDFELSKCSRCGVLASQDIYTEGMGTTEFMLFVQYLIKSLYEFPNDVASEINFVGELKLSHYVLVAGIGNISDCLFLRGYSALQLHWATI